MKKYSPKLNYRPTQFISYKVIIPGQNNMIGYCGFTLEYVENNHPHARIVKVTSHHLYGRMNKNWRNNQ